MIFFNKNQKPQGRGIKELLKLSFSRVDFSCRVDFSQPRFFSGRLKSTLLSNDKNPAFTLAEVLLVLVILGVIAAITMPTLNLSGNKEKALEVKAMKVMGDLDKALDLIKFNDSNGDLFSIYDPYTPSNTISIGNTDDKEKIKAVLAKYLKITNKPCNDSSCYCTEVGEYGTAFYLNNGACVGVRNAPVYSTFDIPGSGRCEGRVRADAKIYIDVNGSDGPNQARIDRFSIPLHSDGIFYLCSPCAETTRACAECPPGDPSTCIRCLTKSLRNGRYDDYHCVLVEGECTNCGFVDPEPEP